MRNYLMEKYKNSAGSKLNLCRSTFIVVESVIIHYLQYIVKFYFNISEEVN